MSHFYDVMLYVYAVVVCLEIREYEQKKNTHFDMFENIMWNIFFNGHISRSLNSYSLDDDKKGGAEGT